MSKIKAIEITDFRVYEKTHLFDFSTPGGVANLVAIYAPNGFGKTSFFDAAEWAFSNSIKRFEQNITKEEIDQKEYASDDQILLTNRKAFTDGRNGRIEILLDDTRTIVRETRPRRINNSEVKFDYRVGGFSGSFSEPEISSVVNTNILTQDQIDSFLRFKSPEDKFTDLKVFWPEGEDITATFASITSCHRILELEISQTKRQIQTLNEELRALGSIDSNIQTANEWIERLTAESSIGFNVSSFPNEVTDNLYNSTKELVLSYIKRLRRILEGHEKSLDSMIDLKNQLTEYHESASLSETKISLLSKYKSKEKLYSERVELGKKLLNFRELLLESQRSLVHWESLERLRNQYVDAMDSLQLLKVSLQQTLLDNEQLISRLHLLTIRNDQFSALIREKETKLALQRSRLISFDQNYIDFKTLEDQKKTVEVQINKLAKQSSELDIELADTAARMRVLLNVASSADFSQLSDADRSKLESVLSQYYSCIDELEQIERLITEKDGEIKRKGNLDENLERIIAWGEEYVLGLQLSNCPLCKTSFDDISSLLGAIRKDKAPVLSLTIAQRELEALISTRDEIRLKQQSTRQIVDAYVKEELDEIRAANAQQQIANDVVKQQISMSSGQKIELEEKLLPLDRYFADIQLDDSYEMKTSSPESEEDSEFAGQRDNPEILRQSLSNRLITLEEYLHRLRNIAAKCEELTVDCRQRIASNDNNRLRLNNEIALIQDGSVYIEVNTLLGKMSLNNMPDELAINNEISGLKDSIGRNEMQIQASDEKLTQIDHSLSTSEITYSPEQIAGESQLLTLEIDKLEQKISAFLTTYKRLMESDIVGLNYIEDKEKELKRIVAAHTIELENLEKFLSHLEVIVGNVKKTEIKEKIRALESTLPSVELAASEFLSAKEDCFQAIEAGINEYFNMNFINHIYQRIDPHPILTQIDFRPEIGQKGPRLAVRAKGHNTELSPVLYMSAGQVNVLSLSIFLAKAIERGHAEIDTIFMDDPVQNLSDINILSFIDLLRTFMIGYDKQLILSTHDEKFFRLLQHKLPEDSFNSKFFELASYGQIRRSSMT